MTNWTDWNFSLLVFTFPLKHWRWLIVEKNLNKCFTKCVKCVKWRKCHFSSWHIRKQFFYSITSSPSNILNNRTSIIIIILLFLAMHILWRYLASLYHSRATRFRMDKTSNRIRTIECIQQTIERNIFSFLDEKKKRRRKGFGLLFTWNELDASRHHSS